MEMERRDEMDATRKEMEMAIHVLRSVDEKDGQG